MKNNILDYLDNQLKGDYPAKFILPKEKIIEIEKLIREARIKDCWIDFKTKGLLNNYRGIKLEVTK
jgi:hypothetical protein